MITRPSLYTIKAESHEGSALMLLNRFYAFLVSISASV